MHYSNDAQPASARILHDIIAVFIQNYTGNLCKKNASNAIGDKPSKHTHVHRAKQQIARLSDNAL